MGLALDEARAAAAAGEVPVGAVLVRTRPPRLPPWEEEAGETSSSPFQPVVLAADRNRIEASHDATSHAELLVLRAAAAAASRPGGWRLGGTTLYVTVEPCPMCAGAALLARVDRVVWGAPNPGTGADGGWVGLLAAARAGAGAAEGGLDGGNGRPHRSHPGLEVGGTRERGVEVGGGTQARPGTHQAHTRHTHTYAHSPPFHIHSTPSRSRGACGALSARPSWSTSSGPAARRARRPRLRLAGRRRQ